MPETGSLSVAWRRCPWSAGNMGREADDHMVLALVSARARSGASLWLLRRLCHISYFFGRNIYPHSMAAD